LLLKDFSGDLGILIVLLGYPGKRTGWSSGKGREGGPEAAVFI
jgi:hypothetical protein